MTNTYDVVVIGAGLAGIAAALRLNKQGYKVLVLEQSDTFGGKLGTIEWEDYRWDKGPSLFTLPHQVDALFELYGKKPSDLFTYHKMPETCHYYFNDGTNFLLKCDREERSEDLVKHFYEREGHAAIKYIDEAEKTYNSIGGLFIDNPKYGWRNIFDKALLRKYPLLMSKKVRGSLHALNTDKFENPNLVQLFDRFATYNGSNPFKTSGLYSMISNLELNDGTYFPTKGMRSIVESLYNLAVDNGIDFRFNETNIRVNGKDRNYTVHFNEAQINVTKVVSAIECVNFYKKVLDDQRLAAKYAAKEPSSSAVIFYWAVEKIIPELKLHNIFFSDSYLKEFTEAFQFKQIPEQPTLYLHISSIVNPHEAPENGQNWFLMMNTPAGVYPTDEQKDRLREIIYKIIQDKFGVDIKPYVRHQQSWDAKGIAADTGSYLGALYGASSNAKLAALTRHGNTSKKYKGIYFVGGTVHPGGGIPLVLKSSKIVADIIAQEKD